MNKPVVGIVVGAILGILDGATAWFTPAARPEIAGILMGSGVKGMVVGVLSGKRAASAALLKQIDTAFKNASFEHNGTLSLSIPGAGFRVRVQVRPRSSGDRAAVS